MIEVKKQEEELADSNEDKEQSGGSEMTLSLYEWVEDDNDGDDDDDVDSQLRPQIPQFSQHKRSSPLEALAPDISTLILQHLTVHELATVSQVSQALYHAARHDDLWKQKLESRWNYTCTDSINWYQAYIQAYQNTHDLWMTHWNCVYPQDGLSPGRCCIQYNNENNTRQQQCPTCRYLHNPSAGTTTSSIRTAAQAVAAATTLRVQQSPAVPPYSPDQAERAFSTASTLHRELDIQQYQSRALHFLTDLLFFEVHDGSKELRDLHHLLPPRPRQDVAETALHSWHLVQFTNPDFNRPLVWRVSIQRPDCFTVTPSEGYLPPGQTSPVVFGVRPLGSLLAQATQQLNSHREGVDEFWATVYTEEAHLPACPFVIHYHYAAVIPCRRAGDESSLHPQPQPSHPPVESPWQRFAQPQQPVRTMYLSAHVHANYPLSEFIRATLVPFTAQDHWVFCAPQLLEEYPSIWRRLQNQKGEQDDAAHDYRTEKKCESCHRQWGVRLEELGQAYVLQKLECELDKQRRDRLFGRVFQILRLISRQSQTTHRYLQVLYCLHSLLTDYKGAPWMTRRQKRVLLQWEAKMDELLRANAASEDLEGDDDRVPWRHAGMYRHALCTDSVFGNGVEELLRDETVLWKDEQSYLEAFSHLAHSPGRFCLGPQEDPNHLQAFRSNRFSRRQKGIVTDIFMDDPICGLQSALCVLCDPRSLLVHGIYDRITYPGTLIRRPKLPYLPPLKVSSWEFEVRLEKFIDTPEKLAYYQVQGSLDMDALLLVDSMCAKPGANKGSRCPWSLGNYLANIPAPGAGRYPLSTLETMEADQGDISDTARIAPLTFDAGFHLSSHDREGAPSNDAYHSRTASQTAVDAHGPNLNHMPPALARGPRALNFLWVLSSQIGWTVQDNQGAASVYVDRRILIGAQWLSISLMAAPLFWTLFARYAKWIPAEPIDYPLEALPFDVETKMRFLTERECGYVSMMLVFVWLCLGRWIERYTSRDFFRAMLEQVPFDEHPEQSIISRFVSRFSQFCQHRWDAICPLFLQRLVFTPQWNRRSRNDLLKHVAFWRSRDRREHRSLFRAEAGRGLLFFDNTDGRIHLGEESSGRKLVIAMVVALGSFSASSPHFFLNLLTVFSCSISLGLSMSLQSMETGRAGVTVSTTGSILKALSLVTIVILAFLVGQLVGSSGGILFLAEFVVTSISLILGGAGTISAGAMESWATFFCLSATAFWGYLFGRVAIMEGIRQKRSGFSSIVLCISLAVVLVLWLVAFLAWKWEAPVQLVIFRPLLANEIKNLNRKYISKRIQ